MTTREIFMPERISDKLEPGLEIDEVVLRLHYWNDNSDRSQRGLSFYLCDMDQRAVQQACGARHAVVFAEQHLVMSARRARELIQVGKFLRDLTLVDLAFAERRLSWSKVLMLMRVVMPHNQKQWVELAERRSCRDLAIDVSRATMGLQPRKGKGKGAGGQPKARFKVIGQLELDDWNLFEELRVKLMEEIGALVTDTMVIEKAVRVLAAAELTSEGSETRPEEGIDAASCELVPEGEQSESVVTVAGAATTSAGRKLTKRTPVCAPNAPHGPPRTTCSRSRRSRASTPRSGRWR